MENNETPVASAPVQYQSRMDIVKTILKWFLPAGIIVAFFVGLGLAGFCILFCSPTLIETVFIWIGLGFIVASLIYVPVISAKKISRATTKRSLVWQTVGLTAVGYAIIFGITFGWVGVSSYRPGGWKSSLNERMLDWVQVSVSKILDFKRDSANKGKINSESFQFTSTSSELTLINSHDAILSLTGTMSGLDKLSQLKGNLQYNLAISEVAVGDMVAQGDVVRKLKGEHFALGEELVNNTIAIGGGDSQQLTIQASLPKEFAALLKNNPNTNFKIKLELLSMSSYTYQKFNFTSLWSQDTESIPKYAGQYLKDRYNEINFRLPESAIKYTKIDEQGNFVTESDNQVSYAVTTNPKMSLCCETPEFRVSQAGNGMSVDEYLSKVPWRNEIISKKVSKPGSFQLGIIEATPTIASPYKAFIHSRYGEVYVYELTGKNSGLEELYNLYLEKFKSMGQFMW